MWIKRGLAVVMSANKRSGPFEHVDCPLAYFDFEQTTPIPSYLIAIGAGNLASREIGPRSLVWCEPEVLDKAAWEFADAETFIKLGEELTCPYAWERYDILLLPPSFPYGGMENPCLTFLTPSLLAGDRSLVDVLAHEISHSWTGNLVTAANWEHFWLNEGFTMFLERKIIGRLHGEAVRQFNAVVGLSDLKEAVDLFGPENQATLLQPDLTATDPDDVFSSIPYEKGHTFLAVLEEAVGGPTVFEPYFKAHISYFAGKSITTDDFLTFFRQYFANQIEEIDAKVNWDAWLKQPGHAPQLPNYDRSLMKPCEELVQLAFASASNDAALYSSLSLDQKLVFLDLLAAELQQKGKDISEAQSLALMERIDVQFGLGQERNVELCLKWYMLAVRAGYTMVVPAVLEFICQHGRMKYNRPLYRELYKLGGEFREAAISTFISHRSFYHPIAASMIEKDLKLA